MKFTLQLVVDNEQGDVCVEDITQMVKKPCEMPGYCMGLTLNDAKTLLKSVQQKIIHHEVQAYTTTHRACPDCKRQRNIKGYHAIQYRTLFGIINIPSMRLYHCCNPEESIEKTFSLLKRWLPEHISPELRYLETKWGSCMSYDKTAALLQDVLPIYASLNGETIRKHLHKTAIRQEGELKDKPFCISGCLNDWAKLPKPDKPLTVGIDGGYVRSCIDRKTNFEVIIGKSFSKTQAAKRFGFVQSEDERPERRLLNVLRAQGMQENQQVTFMSDGADNVRDLQYVMHPESEHILDWFHLTMRLTVLNQFAKGLIKSDPIPGKTFQENATHAKWYLWHGSVESAIEKLDDCYVILMNDDLDESETLHYKHKKKVIKHLNELMTYIDNNRHLIPNYGERWRYGETIATSFVESTVNEVITKRMVKKQQMQWSQTGAHYLLQTRTATLNGELPGLFEKWYPGLKIENKNGVNQQAWRKTA